MHDQPASGETRKLQEVGGGTYTVSIPKEWATERSLSAGDTVYLYPDGDGSLVVCPKRDSAEGAGVTVHTGDIEGEALDQTLRAAYTTGLECLTLRTEGGFDQERRRHIDQFVRSRAGMRVAEEGQEVTIRISLDDGEVSVERSVVQLQFVTISLCRTAVDLALGENSFDSDRIPERRADAHRLGSLVTRQFARSLSHPASVVYSAANRPRAFDCYRTARALVRLATVSASIAATGEDRAVDGTAVDALRSVAEALRLYVEDATRAVVDGVSPDGNRELRETRTELSTLVADTETVVDDAAERRLLALLEDGAGCGDRIAGVARQAAVRRDR